MRSGIIIQGIYKLTIAALYLLVYVRVNALIQPFSLRGLIIKVKGSLL